MNDGDYILMIVEGEVREVNIINHVENFFDKKDKFKYINLPARQNIYMLWKVLKEDDFQTDIIEIIREKVEGADKILSGISRDDISETYLFFDLDAQQKNLPYGEDNAITVISEMLDSFDNETESGKLYISYPMIEALRDFGDKGCITFSGDCEIDNGKLVSYKTLTGEGNRYSSINKYKEDEWRLIFKTFVLRLSCMLSLSEVISYDHYKHITPKEVFAAELPWLQENKVFILSAIPEFILDYFPERFWKSKIKVKKLDKRYCLRK